MTDINIPPAALEAAARAICAGNKWDAPCAEPCTDCVPEARAACLAMLTAWPGLSRVHRDWDGTALVCLPLPQENSNAEG